MDDLHAQVIDLNITRASTRVAVHCLIELGIVTVIECARPDCIRPTREFKTESARHPDGISIGHVIAQHSGGSDLPSNIRLEHFGCNSGWRKDRKPPTEINRKCLLCNTWFKNDKGLAVHRSRGCPKCDNCQLNMKDGYAMTVHLRDCAPKEKCIMCKRALDDASSPCRPATRTELGFCSERKTSFNIRDARKLQANTVSETINIPG